MADLVQEGVVVLGVEPGDADQHVLKEDAVPGRDPHPVGPVVHQEDSHVSSLVNVEYCIEDVLEFRDIVEISSSQK